MLHPLIEGCPMVSFLRIAVTVFTLGIFAAVMTVTILDVARITSIAPHCIAPDLTGCRE